MGRKDLDVLDPQTKLIISDSVPQLSEVSKHYGIRQYNIQHFTWDWLYFSLFGEDEIFERLNNDYLEWGEFIFPPLTPKKNLEMHKSYNNIDLIVNRRLVRLANKN